MSKPAFIKTDTTDIAAGYVAGMVNGALQQDKQVLLLLPGGSSIAIAAAAYMLFDRGHLGQLTMLLTDERYGDVGHADSNWVQLAAAGVPVVDNPNALPVLTGLPFEATVRRFDQLLREHIDRADIVIGMYGMGTDGHTAGILPGTPAVDATDWAAGYVGSDFTRLTMTFEAIRQVDMAVLCAFGTSKQPKLQQLQQAVPLAEQPAQILTTLPLLTVFSDTTGDSVQ